jgi:sulfur carrier protein ThiS
MNRNQMKINLAIAGEKDHRHLEIDAGTSYADILRGQGMSPHSTLVFVNGKPRPHDATANEGETVEVLSVFSGG